MIKAAATDQQGRPVAIVGLSLDNIRLLVEGRPIKTDTDFLGFPGGTLMIFVGKTEEEMAEMMKPLIKDDTKVTIGPVEKK